MCSTVIPVPLMHFVFSYSIVLLVDVIGECAVCLLHFQRAVWHKNFLTTLSILSTSLFIDCRIVVIILLFITMDFLLNLDLEVTFVRCIYLLIYLSCSSYFLFSYPERGRLETFPFIIPHWHCNRLLCQYWLSSQALAGVLDSKLEP